MKPVCRLLLFCAFAIPAMGAEYTVAVAGRDDNPGTPARPFRTFKTALAKAAGGDTVWIKGGVYEEPLIIAHKGEAVLTVRAAPNESVVIRHVAPLPPEFVLDQGLYSIDYEQDVAGIVWDIANHPRVCSFLTRHKSKEALVREPGGGFCFDPLRKKLFIKAESRDDDPNRQPLLATFIAYGMSLSGRNIVVEGIGIELAGSVGIGISNAENVTLRRCWVGGLASQWSFLYNLADSRRITLEACIGAHGFGAAGIGGCQDLTIRHCVFYRTRGHGLLFSPGNARLNITDNIFQVNQFGATVYYMQEKPADSVLDYNCVLKYGPATPQYLGVFIAGETFLLPDLVHAKTGYERHSICADPEFASTRFGQEDFTTAEDSPCRNKGTDGGIIGLTKGKGP